MPMTEKLARTIFISLSGASSPADDAGWNVLPDSIRDHYRTAAYRAIMTLRTPSPEMLKEGNRRGMPMDAGNVWERMIFTALQSSLD
jgi:hypothetical protein